jgi:hypothetical protein
MKFGRSLELCDSFSLLSSIADSFSCPLATGLLEDLLEDLLEVLLVLLPQSWQLTTFFLNSCGWSSLLGGWTELKVRTTYHMFSNVCTNSSELRLVL